jgi:phosphopantetheinyl transferase (holo-ACP synthase)
MYQQVEIVTDHLRPGEQPRLAWGGRESHVCVSLSHSNGQSCAYLDSGGPIGLDLEEAAPRLGSFYQHNFSVRERGWVNQIERQSGTGWPWLYTLLWTLKEAAIKSDCSGSSTLWSMPLIEVRLPAEPGDWAFPKRGGLGATFSQLRACVRLPAGESLFEVAISSNAGRILSVLKRIYHTEFHEYNHAE